MRGILFNQNFDMLRLVMAGVKTETRREGELKKLNELITKNEFKVSNFQYLYRVDKKLSVVFHSEAGKTMMLTSHYKRDEILYLKESTRRKTSNSKVIYQLKNKKSPLLLPGKFDNKLFMGEDRARTYIKIKNIYVQKISQISESSVRREGIIVAKHLGEKIYYVRKENKVAQSKDHVQAFRYLVNAVISNGKEFEKPFTNEHYLFVYEFSLHKSKVK